MTEPQIEKSGLIYSNRIFFSYPLSFGEGPYSLYISYDENELKKIMNIHNVKYPLRNKKSESFAFF
jgi:hypothetical protein